MSQPTANSLSSELLLKGLIVTFGLATYSFFDRSNSSRAFQICFYTRYDPSLALLLAVQGAFLMGLLCSLSFANN